MIDENKMTNMVDAKVQNPESANHTLLSIQDLHVWFELRRWGFRSCRVCERRGWRHL